MNYDHQELRLIVRTPGIQFHWNYPWKEQCYGFDTATR